MNRGWQIASCSGENTSLVVRKPAFAYAKTKTQINCAVNAQLISAFVHNPQGLEVMIFEYFSPRVALYVR